jgi:hypothetical protein
MMKYSFATSFLLLFVFACQTSENPTFPEALSIQKLPLPTESSGMPNHFVDAQGNTTISWIEKIADTIAVLQMAQLQGDRWTTPKEIARGTDWFVNWADFPALAQFPDAPEHLAAHWLQKRAAGTYDYDVHIATSKDGGQQWTPSFLPHRDSIAAEHGFVTLLPIAKDRIFATWLDGRNTKVAGSAVAEEHGHGGGGAMTLRAAEFDLAGNLFAEAELDQRVCDCCQTDAVISEQGPIVVYRDRSEKEIRDISVVRRINGVWSDPQTIGSDHWQINGCPVNGPAIAAKENTVAVAWFTMAADTPKVQVVFSQDGGASFGMPIRLDQGYPLGRVDIVLLDANTALVSYLESTETATNIRVVPVSKSGKVGAAVAEIPGEQSRRSGFPVLEPSKGGFILATTKVVEGKTKVETFRLQ